METRRTDAGKAWRASNSFLFVLSPILFSKRSPFSQLHFTTPPSPLSTTSSTLLLWVRRSAGGTSASTEAEILLPMPILLLLFPSLTSSSAATAAAMLFEARWESALSFQGTLQLPVGWCRRALNLLIEKGSSMLRLGKLEVRKDKRSWVSHLNALVLRWFYEF